MKVYLETMGCQMNRLDSELAEGLLRAGGHQVVADRRSAEAVVYNTCAVRRHAEEKVFSRLGADGQRKAEGKPLIVAVLGCVAQRMGQDLRRKYPQVDVVCGPGQLHRLVELLEQAAAGRPSVALDATRVGTGAPPRGYMRGGAPVPPRAGVGRASPAEDETAADGLEAAEVHRDPAVGKSPSQAFVRVMRGCDKFCTYCVVPFVRGPERSRPPGAIVEEVRRLVGAGRTQITLLGQTVNSYHYDADGNGRAVRFSDLLALVSPVPGLRRLRFITSHPLDFSDDILQAMRDLPNVCPYVHCPAQSGSDAMLKRMNRRYTRARYDEWVDRARAVVPGVVLSGDFIVGFPGESEDDHAASAGLLRRSGYKNSFIFKYSPRPGTVANRLYPDEVPDSVKRRRNNELLAVQGEVGLAHHRALVGRTVEVLVEGPSPRAARAVGRAYVHAESEVPRAGMHALQLVGRTRGDHIVVFDGEPTLADQYVDVRIESATALTLTGKLTR